MSDPQDEDTHYPSFTSLDDMSDDWQPRVSIKEFTAVTAAKRCREILHRLVRTVSSLGMLHARPSDIQRALRISCKV